MVAASCGLRCGGGVGGLGRNSASVEEAIGRRGDVSRRSVSFWGTHWPVSRRWRLRGLWVRSRGGHILAEGPERKFISEEFEFVVEDRLTGNEFFVHATSLPRMAKKQQILRGTSNLSLALVGGVPGKTCNAAVEQRDHVGADIEAKNSVLDLFLVRRLMSNSIASTVESGLSTLRRTQTRLSSSGGSRSSSLRVPER
jgi:hypothetical protein